MTAEAPGAQSQSLLMAEDRPLYERVKRGLDLGLAVLLLIVSAPLLALIALAIRLDSPGPAIYRQVRVGQGGRTFVCYKFRTMRSGAEDEAHREFMRRLIRGQVELDGYDDSGVLKMTDDGRITRVGRIMRRMSLDELPQLVNVLKGEMSLVGPRPELPWLVERYAPWQRKRFAVPQGITGWWQVHGRSDKPMHLHTEEDLYYIRHYSLLLDLQILWKTIGAVIRRRGAF